MCEILSLVLRLSQRAVHFSSGKQLIFFSGGLWNENREGGVGGGVEESLSSISLSLTPSRFSSPLQLVEGLCPLSLV